MGTNPDLPAGDPSKQWEWHESYRDIAKNQFRTSYTDMTHFKEVHVRSDFPAGYGGHDPSMRFDNIFRNTSFDRNMHLRRQDPSRDAKPSFQSQIDGIPHFTKYPRRKSNNPTYKATPHPFYSAEPLTPWARTLPPAHRVALTMNNVPPTMTEKGRLAKSRSVPGGGLVGAGAQLAMTPQTAAEGMLGSSGELGGSGNARRLQRTVSSANAEGMHMPMPHESDVLREGLAGH